MGGSSKCLLIIRHMRARKVRLLVDPIKLASQLVSCLNLLVLLLLKPWSHQQYLLNQKCYFSKIYAGYPRKMRNTEITLKEFAHCISTWIQKAFIYVCIHIYTHIYRYTCVFLIIVLSYSLFSLSLNLVARLMPVS